MIQKIVVKNITLAIIISSSYKRDGIEFFSDENDSQQLGYMNRPEGYVIAPHRHNIVPRQVHLTQEVLLIKSGKVRVDFYDNEQKYIQSAVLNKGDVILLADGGHGFEMLEESQIIEIKQGPYCGERDKVRFEPVEKNEIVIK